MSISGRTRLLGIIGHPVAHSLSPRMQNASFAAEGMDYVYVAMDVVSENLPAAVSGFVALGFRGFTVTMPHKQAVLPLLDHVDEKALISGAVNTVVIEDSKLHGYNTDGSGLVEACKESGIELAGRRVLLLGAGGLGSSIAVALGDEGIGGLRIVDLSNERAGELTSTLREANEKIEVQAYHPDALAEAARKVDVVVNATPLGMKEGDPLPFPLEGLCEDTAIFDAVYLHDGETPLVQLARERGVRVATGKRLLLHQGVQAQRLWTGREPNVAAMSDAIS